MSILKLQSAKIRGSLARNARFDAPTCLVSSLWFSCGLGVSMGEAAKPLLFEGFQAGCHVVLRGRRGTLWHSTRLITRRKSFCVAGAILLRRFHRRCLAFFVASAALWTRPSSFCVAGAALHTLHSTLHSPPFNFTLHTLHPHFTLYTPHSTLYTPHSTLYTPHSTLSTPHCRLVTGEICRRVFKYVQINYCRKVFCVTAYPCVSTSVPFNIRVSIRVRGLHLLYYYHC